MITKMKNLLEVTEQDTLGKAVVKGLVKGHIVGVAYSTIGIGALALIGLTIDRKMEVEIEEEEDVNDQLQKDWAYIEELAKRGSEKVNEL